MSKILFLDFERTNLSEDFKNKILETVKTKFEETDTIIIDDLESKFYFIDQGKSISSVLVHDSDASIDPSPGAIGRAFSEYSTAEVNIQEVGPIESDGFADKCGTVISHEAGHLYLPHGHSFGEINLMSEGPILDDYINKYGCDGLDFSEIQKAIIRGDVEVENGMTLSDYDNLAYSSDLPEDNLSLDPPDSELDDFTDNDFDIDLGDLV
jgi:hypothetical protein